MIVVAPARRAPAMAALPTPPHPNTATLSPRPTSPVNMAAPSPAITPQPSSPATSGLAAGSTFVHWPAATRVFSAKAPIPSAGRQRLAVEGHLLGGVVRREAVPGPAPPAAAARPAHRPPVEDDEVAGSEGPGAHVRADGLDDAGRLVPEQEREVVVDAALAVVEVGVAHAARLDPDERLAGPGIGHLDRHQLDRLHPSPWPPRP